MTTYPDHCAICPTVLNREKQLAIARHALSVSLTPESVRALAQMDILARLAEPALCAPCEVSPLVTPAVSRPRRRSRGGRSRSHGRLHQRVRRRRRSGERKMDQSVLDRAVKIATKAAMGGHPVERIVWIPPATAASDPGGAFAVTHCRPLSGSETAPWDK